MKKQLLLLAMILLPMIAHADESGTCGDNVTWTFEEATGTLTISGTGNMKDYGWISLSEPEEYRYVPWNNYLANIKKVVIEEGVTSIGKESFVNCSNLTSVIIPSSLTGIGSTSFANCSNITSVTIPDGVTAINDRTFYNCGKLSSINLGKSVKYLNKEAFAKCVNMKDIYIYAGTVLLLGVDVFNGSSIEYTTLHVPATLFDDYKYSEPWKNFKSVVAIEGYTPETPTPSTGEKCAMPTIVMKDGKLIFGCETPDVEFNYELTANDSKTGKGNNLSLKPSYIIKVYASKDGYENSEIATQAIYLKHGDINCDGEVDIADAVKIVNLVVGKIDALARPAKEVKDEKVPQ